MGVVVGLLASLTWALERDGRQAERFLAAHPDPAEAG